LSDGSGSEIGRADTAAETVAGEGAREMQVLCGREEGLGFLGTMLTVKYSGVVDARSISLLVKESDLDMIVDNKERS
jgi:hypothetical protein